MKKKVFTFSIPLVSGLVLWIIVTAGCKNHLPADPGAFTIQLTLTAYPNEPLVLQEVQPDGFVPVDTAYTDGEGQTQFSLLKNEQGIYFITIGTQRLIVLSKPGETTSFTSKTDDLSDVQTDGWSHNTTLHNYLKTFDTRRREVDSLSVCLDKSKDRSDYLKIRDSVGNRYVAIFSDQQQLTIQYLKENKTSLGTLIALNQRSGPRALLTIEEHFGLMQQIDSALQKNHQGNKHVDFLHKTLVDYQAKLDNEASQHQRLAPGQAAPEIVLNGANDETFRLSDLRGKTVLLHFWASWSANYRKDFNTLQLMSQKYGAGKFDMVSVSFDNKRFQWIQALQNDYIQWTQLTDLLYPNSPLQKLYNIGDKLPVYFIIDPEGRIVGRYATAIEANKILKTMPL